jgi:hypothetical protein
MVSIDLILVQIASILGTLGSILMIYHRFKNPLNAGFHFLVLSIAYIDLLSSLAWTGYTTIQMFTNSSEWLWYGHRISLTWFYISGMLGLLLAVFLMLLVFNKIAISQIPWKTGVFLSIVLSVGFVAILEVAIPYSNIVKRNQRRKLIEFVANQVIFGSTLISCLFSIILLWLQRQSRKRTHPHTNSFLISERKKVADTLMLKLLLYVTAVNLFYWIPFAIADTYVLLNIKELSNPFEEGKHPELPWAIFVYWNMIMMPSKGLAHHFAIQVSLVRRDKVKPPESISMSRVESVETPDPGTISQMRLSIKYADPVQILDRPNLLESVLQYSNPSETHGNFSEQPKVLDFDYQSSRVPYSSNDFTTFLPSPNSHNQSFDTPQMLDSFYESGQFADHSERQGLAKI